MDFVTKKKILYLLVFSVIALVAYQINFSPIIGGEGKSYFNFFQFVGPIGAAIFTVPFGAISVLLVQGGNFLITGTAMSWLALAQFFPMVFAAIYFGSKRKYMLAVPLACMALFVMHPEGAKAWFYSLFWLIPVFGKFVFADKLFMRGLGTTFTAHAVGSVAFIYAFNIPAATWTALLPVTAMERIAFAAGICVSYVCINTVLNMLASRLELKAITIDPRYILTNIFVRAPQPQPVPQKEKEVE
jgi:hypothetical protein